VAARDPIGRDVGGNRMQSHWLAARQAVVQTIWPSGVLPTRALPDETTVVHNAAHVRRLVWRMAGPFLELNSSVFYLPRRADGVPSSDTAILYHHGHESHCAPEFPLCASWDLGNVSQFFHDQVGHDLFTLHMPLRGPNAPADPNQTRLHFWFQRFANRGDRPIRYFMEPIVLTINYALRVLHYQQIALVGFSGGGWATTLAAAIDPRISISVPASGSLPLSFRTETFKRNRDWEQGKNPAPWYLYAANYTVLYLLAALEPRRHCVQMLHENDPCCFYARGRHNTIARYNARVREWLAQVGPPASHGHFSTAASECDPERPNECAHHKLRLRDRVLFQAILHRAVPAARDGSTLATPAYHDLPCDVLTERPPTMPCPRAAEPDLETTHARKDAKPKTSKRKRGQAAGKVIAG
jgi:pimeloyl-ACP methyl ester carboxylesterase